MITTFRHFWCNFAPVIIQLSIMINNNYQKAAREYAHHYVDYLLNIEGVLGHHMDERLSQLVEQKVKEYMESHKPV